MVAHAVEASHVMFSSVRLRGCGVWLIGCPFRWMCDWGLGENAWHLLPPTKCGLAAHVSRLQSRHEWYLAWTDYEPLAVHIIPLFCHVLCLVGDTSS